MNLKEFKNPGPLYRNAPFWSWNDKLDSEELKRQIRQMAQKGWGGYFMHSRVGLVTEYLSPEWMEMVRVCAQEARATNTYAWLYDEDKWPSGFAGGEVPKNEEYRSRALVLLKEDEITENDTVMCEVKKDDRKYFICKRVSSLGNLWFNGTSYVDLMNPEAVREFINCTHERYKEACGEYFGKEIPGMFTDEPCYLMWGHYDVPVLPWSDYLPEYFKRLKGYSIEEHLVQLFFDIDDYRKIRYDFFDAATRLFMENFTKQYYKWCKQNNLKMTGHFMAEDTLLSQLQWIGAAMPHYEFMHWPGIDKLGRHIKQLVTVKQVSSVVDQLGKERAFCEVFGCVGQQVSFYHRKWIADWQAALGISFVNSHLSLYSMRGERKRDYPANLFYQQPWWENERNFADYIGRLCYAVSQGKREVDILVIHPIASVWSEYSPLHAACNFALEREVYDRPFADLSQKLVANKLDFHYGDEIIMEKHACIEKGKLVVGNHSYSTVVVPPMLTIRSNTFRLLREFVNAAPDNRLILIRPYPNRIDGVETEIKWPDEVIKVDSIEEAVAFLDNHCSNRIKIIDEITGRGADKVICHVRASGTGKWVFIANTDEKREVRVRISLPWPEKPVVLDLASGEVFDIPVKIQDRRTEFRAKFYPAGSILLFYPTTYVEAKAAPAFFDSGVELENEMDTIKLVSNWRVTLLEPNAMPISMVTLYLDGRLVAENQHVARVWHNWFYKVPDGTPFKAEYSFDVLEVPQGEVFAVVEAAENLSRIIFNGVEVKPLKTSGEVGVFDPDKNWKDVSFTKVPLTGLIRKGINTLVLEGKKVNNITGPGTHIRVNDSASHFPTEVESVYIVGNFAVRDENREKFYIDGNVCTPNPVDLTGSGYPFYAGRAEFTSCINYRVGQRRAYLKINDVKAACIELYVNGKYADVKYWEPYVFDMTDLLKDGKNEIKIVASTTLFNLMGPNWIVGIENDEGIGPRTFIDFYRYTEKYTLLPFGIGSASLKIRLS